MRRSVKKNWMKDILERAVTSLREQGFGATVFKLGGLIADRLFDVRYGINTCGTWDLDALTVNSHNKERGNYYQPSRYLLLKKLFGIIEPLIPSDAALVDFGCGKGRVLLVASQFGFQEVRGVEFAQELCEIATNNCAVYKAKTGVKSHFQIVESDAENYDVRKNDNVFFMFNPFDHTILGKVLDNIVRSLRKRDRKILIIYHNPAYNRIIEKHDYFEKLREFNFWGNIFIIYSNIKSV